MFDDFESGFEHKLKSMKPQFGRKTSQEEIDALKMIMLSRSP